MKTALVIERKENTAAIMKKMLADLGFDVTITHDEKSALESYQKNPPTVILTDFGAEQLLDRAVRGGASTVIFCSSECAPDKIQSALLQGAREYIMKPFDNDILQSKLMMAEVL